MTVLPNEPTTDRPAAIAAVHDLHDAGRAAGLVGPVNGRFVALDLDAPFVDVVDALIELGLGCNEAEDVAWKRVGRGY
jgi:hypothetical protein